MRQTCPADKRMTRLLLRSEERHLHLSTSCHWGQRDSTPGMRLRHTFKNILLRVPPLRRAYLDAAVRRFVQTGHSAKSPHDAYAALDSFLSSLLTYDRIVIRIADFDSSTVTDVFIRGRPDNTWGLDEHRPLSGTATELIMNRGSYILIGDCDDPVAKMEYPFLDTSPSTDKLPSMLVVPVYRGAEVIGSIMLRTRHRNTFSERDAELVEEAARLITPTLMQSIHARHLERELAEGAALAELGRGIGSAQQMSDVWPVIIKTAEQLFEFDRLVVAFVEEDGESLTDVLVHGDSIPVWDQNPSRKLAELPAASVVREHRGLIAGTDDTDKDHFELIGARVSEVSGLLSTMYAPLVSGDRVIGTTSIRSRTKDAYSPLDLSTFERFAIQLAGPLKALLSHETLLATANEKAARRELEIRNQQLSELAEARERILTTISHELRTPLTSILAFAGLVSSPKNDRLSEKDRKHLDIILRNGERLKTLINDLLELSRMEAEAVLLNVEDVDLRELLEDIVDGLRPLFESRSQAVHITVRIGTQISADRQRLDQIITNLLANANKYSGDHTEITIAAKEIGSDISISVTDQGKGIAPENVEAIFDAFHRLDGYSTNENPGTGLGLTVSRRLAKAMGGTLSVTDTSISGSTFTLRIPAQQAEAA